MICYIFFLNMASLKDNFGKLWIFFENVKSRDFSIEVRYNWYFEEKAMFFSLYFKGLFTCKVRKTWLSLRNIRCFSSILRVVVKKFWNSKESNNTNFLVSMEILKTLFWRFSAKFLKIFRSIQITMHKTLFMWGLKESNNYRRISKELYFRN